MAKANVEEAELQDFIFLEKSDMAYTHPERKPALLMINPPYGERLEVENIKELYKKIGTPGNRILPVAQPLSSARTWKP